MRLAGLFILASCAVLETYCASLAGENGNLAASKQANSSFKESIARQLSSIEPFLQERARQQADRLSSSQEPLSSLANNLNLSAEPRARQLAYAYVQPSNPYQQRLAQVRPVGYIHPPSNLYYQHQPARLGYNQPQVNSPSAYLQPAPILPTFQAQQPTYLGPEQYGPGLWSTIEATKVIYDQAEDKKKTTPQYKSRLPQLHEVIELADPSIKTFSSKRGDKSSLKTVVDFRLARKVRVPLDPEKVMQPEFHLQEGLVSYKPAKTEHPHSVHTTSRPKETTKLEPKKAALKVENGSDQEEKSDKHIEQEPKVRDQSEGEGDSNEIGGSNELYEESPDADVLATESDESAGGESKSDADEEQQAAHQTEGEADGLAKLDQGELRELDESAGQEGAKDEDKHKELGQLGGDKLDSASEAAGKDISELSKKVVLDLKTSEGADGEQSQKPEGSDQQPGEQKSTTEGQLALAGAIPSSDDTLAQVDAKLGDITRSHDEANTERQDEEKAEPAPTKS